MHLHSADEPSELFLTSGLLLHNYRVTWSACSSLGGFNNHSRVRWFQVIGARRHDELPTESHVYRSDSDARRLRPFNDCSLVMQPRGCSGAAPGRNLLPGCSPKAAARRRPTCVERPLARQISVSIADDGPLCGTIRTGYYRPRADRYHGYPDGCYSLAAGLRTETQLSTKSTNYQHQRTLSR